MQCNLQGICFKVDHFVCVRCSLSLARNKNKKVTNDMPCGIVGSQELWGKLNHKWGGRYCHPNESTQPKPWQQHHTTFHLNLVLTAFSFMVFFFCSQADTSSLKVIEEVTTSHKRYCNVYNQQSASNMSFNCIKTTFAVTVSCSALYLQSCYLPDMWPV